MNKINGIGLEHLTNGAHGNYIDSVLAFAGREPVISQRFGEFVARLRDALEKENADVKVSRKSFYTDVIAAAGNERDSFYMAYKKTVRTFLRLPDKRKAQAAHVLNQHLKDYSISTRMQHYQKTGLFVNFIADLEEKYAEPLDVLSLTPYVGRMKAANEKAIAAMNLRVEERMPHKPGALQASRKATDKAYRALISQVNARIVLEGEAEFRSFMQAVNTEIADYKRKVFRHKTHAAALPEQSG